MFFQRIVTPGLALHTYLIGDEVTKRCLVIDPSRLVAPYIVMAENAGLLITDILETHVHADFVSGAKELKQQLNGKPTIHVSGMGGEKGVPAYADHSVQNGECINSGSIRLQAVHTPGHSPEHLIWLCYDETRSLDTPWFALTGDLLFVGSVGRPDLLGKGEFRDLARQLYYSLFDVLAPWPDFIEICPAHGAGSLCGKALNERATSTLGYERRFNPYLEKKPEDQWIAAIQKELLLEPTYFARLKKLNVTGAPLLSTLTVEPFLEKQGQDSLFLLDVRHPEIFAHSHLPNAVNIPLSSSFYTWIGELVPPDSPLVLITTHENQLADTINKLRLVGLDQPIYTYPFPVTKDEKIKSYHSFSLLTVETLNEQQKNQKNDLYILDVRTPLEWQTGHIEGAHHIELNFLHQNRHQIPHNCLIAVVCRTGIKRRR